MASRNLSMVDWWELWLFFRCISSEGNCSMVFLTFLGLPPDTYTVTRKASDIIANSDVWLVGGELPKIVY